MSTLVGHFVSSPKERVNRDRRDSILFCVEVLQPSQPNGVMSSVVEEIVEVMKERDRGERGK